MADVIKRKNKPKFLIEASFELEVNGKIEVLPLKITKGETVKANILAEEQGSTKEFMDFLKYEFLKIPKDMNVSDDEVINAFEEIGEYIKDKSPRQPKKL